MKIAFVGQLHYFDCCIPSGATKFNYSWGEDYSHILKHKDDFDVWFFIRGEYAPTILLDQLSGKKVWISTEPIEREDVMHGLKEGMTKHFDKCFHYDKTHLPELRKQGINFDGVFQLPVNLDVYKFVNEPIKYDVCFVGRSTQHREDIMGLLKHTHKFLHVAHGLNEEDYVKTVRQAKINLNLHVDKYPQLQHRMQNLMACGCFVMSEYLSHDDDLKAFKHYVPLLPGREGYNSVLDWLGRDEERLKIRSQATAYVRKNFDANKCWNDLLKDVV